jgi:hypothetical protein
MKSFVACIFFLMAFLGINSAAMGQISNCSISPWIDGEYVVEGVGRAAKYEEAVAQASKDIEINMPAFQEAVGKICANDCGPNCSSRVQLFASNQKRVSKEGDEIIVSIDHTVACTCLPKVR